MLTNAHTLLETLVKAQQLERIDQADCRTYLEGWSEKLVYFTSLTLFNTDGQVVCTNVNGELPYQARNHDWFVKAIKDQRFALSDYQLGRNGTPLLIAALPVLSKSQETIGVVALGISLNWLELSGSNVDLPPGRSITALGPDGEILTHHGAGEKNGAKVPPPSKDALNLMNGRGSGTLRAQDAMGATRVYGFKSTQSAGIVVIVGLPRFIEYSEWTNALIQTLISPMVVLLLALLAAAWASEAFIVRHVRSLIKTAEDITSGNLQARSDVDYDEHELGQLAAAMDTMADAIEQSQNELEQQSAANEIIAWEMQHRIGNVLAMAQAIATQTVRRSRSNEEFIDTFSARLRALSVSNHLLLKDNWKSAHLRELLETVLAAHQVAQGKGFQFDGPPVQLDSRATLAISLAIHELATNAVKYGALSRPGGRVIIHWSFSEENDRRCLVLEWRETGGPWTAAPSRKGFGSQMMHMMVEGKLGGHWSRPLRGTALYAESCSPGRSRREPDCRQRDGWPAPV